MNQQGDDSTYDASQEQIEHAIVKLWQETFRLEHVDRDDNFFALGGNSLLGIELMEKVAESLDLQLPVVLLFQNPTPREMARSISVLEAD